MTDSTGGLEAASGAQRIERSFIDDDGTSWRVFEQAFSDYDRRCGMSLIFASDSAVRRVRNYPADWRELSNSALATLSWAA